MGSEKEALLIIEGGALWALSNYLVLPLVKLLGIGREKPRPMPSNFTNGSTASGTAPCAIQPSFKVGEGPERASHHHGGWHTQL